MTDPPSATPGFDVDRPHRLSPRVGLRPEPFGALAYHYDTRRLVFLKARDLVALVESLAGHDRAGDAIDAACAETGRSRSSYLSALASLAESGVVEARHPAEEHAA